MVSFAFRSSLSPSSLSAPHLSLDKSLSQRMFRRGDLWTVVVFFYRCDVYYAATWSFGEARDNQYTDIYPSHPQRTRRSTSGIIFRSVWTFRRILQFTTNFPPRSHATRRWCPRTQLSLHSHFFLCLSPRRCSAGIYFLGCHPQSPHPPQHLTVTIFP